MAPNASIVYIPIESYGIKEYESNFNEGIVSAKRVFANFLQYQNRSPPRNNYHALPTRLAFQEQIGRFTFETRHRLNQTFEARLAQLQEEMSQVTFRTPNRPTLTTNQTRNITMLNNYFRNMSAFTVIGDDIIFELPEQYSDFTFEARSLTHNITMFNNYVRNMPTSVAIDMVSSVPNAEYIAVQVNPITRFQQIIPSNRSSIRFDTNQTPSRAAILDKIKERLSSTNPQSRKLHRKPAKPTRCNIKRNTSPKEHSQLSRPQFQRKCKHAVR